MNRLSEIIIKDAEKILEKVDLSEMEGKSILITGASGLIGTYFLACLKVFSKKKKNGKITAISNSKYPVYLNDLVNYPEIEIIEGDLTNYEFLQKMPLADYIIHAAGYGQPGRFMENPIKTLKLNTETTFCLLDKLKKDGKLLFLSTSEVYSGLTNPPHKESEIGSTNTTHPRSCYIEAKRCGEAICNAYRTNEVNAKSARLSLAYGPGTKPGDLRVINSFIQKGIQGKIELLDNGEAKRTYCYITDAVEILWHILLKGEEPVYNVGGLSNITIADLARKIGKHLNIPVVFPETSSKKISGAPIDVSLNMTKVKQEFGKTKYVPFDEGLERTIEWQKELYQLYLNNEK
mgnify:FL=1